MTLVWAPLGMGPERSYGVACLFRSWLGLLLLGVGVASTGAFATDPLNSNDKPLNGDSESKQSSPRSEFNIIPIAGGSTDIGIGGGFFMGLARLRPGYDPYLWNIESAGLITFKPGDAGGVAVPYVDLFVKLTIPRLFGAPLRLEIRPSYTTETTVRC